MKWFVIGGIAFFLVVVAGVAAGYWLLPTANKKTPGATTTPPPTVATTPTVTVAPSPFATDAGVIKLRADLKSLQGKIDTVDLFEPQIAPPAIDLGLVIK